MAQGGETDRKDMVRMVGKKTIDKWNKKENGIRVGSQN
jgi:hypothetical protein